jgi:hypothetical protein
MMLGGGRGDRLVADNGDRLVADNGGRWSQTTEVVGRRQRRSLVRQRRSLVRQRRSLVRQRRSLVRQRPAFWVGVGEVLRNQSGG